MHPLRILIVDDIPHVRQELRRALEAAGEASGIELHICGEAGSGSEAVVKARQLQPEIVLLDLLMPGMDGFDAAPMIKSACPNACIVALSVLDGPEARQKAAQCQIDTFFVKGVSMMDLIHTYCPKNERKVENEHQL
jgi:DNA-binding NarL/FixJ family response regulator